MAKRKTPTRTPKAKSRRTKVAKRKTSARSATTKRVAKQKKPTRATKPVAKKKTSRPLMVDAGQPRESEPEKDDEAFHLETSEGTDALAEELGEEFVEGATGVDAPAAANHDEELTEEDGGPFVTTAAGTELAGGTDESNPEDAEVEPFPLAVGSSPRK